MGYQRTATSPAEGSGINLDDTSPQFGMLTRPTATPPAPAPNVPEKPVTPTPTTPTPTAPVERYDRLPPGVTQESYDQAAASQYATKDPARAAEEYRTSSLSQMQDRIKAVEDTYSKKLETELADQAPINENNLARTNALSALMGLSGSSSADTRTAKTESDNRRINASIRSKVNTEKMAALDAIYNRIEDGAAKIAEAQLQTNKENQKALLDAVSKNALSNVQAIATTLADTGKTFDDWKASDNGATLKKIMEQTGQSEYQIRQAFKNAIPEDLRPTVHTSYIDDGKGGTIMRQIEFNPITKKVVSNDFPLNVPVSTFNGEQKPIEGKNGELFIKTGVGADGVPIYKDVSPNAGNQQKSYQAGIVGEYQFYADQERKAGREPLSFSAYQNEDANRKERAARAGDILTTKDRLNAQQSLRKEFNGLQTVKDFNDVKSSYNRVKSAYDEALAKGSDDKSKSAADQVLITSFNKLIDPGSTVREGEYARSTAGQSLLAQLKGKAEAALSGGSGLTDADRKSMVDATERLFDDYIKNYNALASEYRGYAGDYEIDPDNIAKPYEDPVQAVSKKMRSAYEGLGLDESYEDAIIQYGEDGLRQILENQGVTFSDGGSGTPIATKAAEIEDGTKGGQCGRFVNKLTGIGLGDSYASKMAKMDKSITYPEPGMVFVTPYKDTGHTGIILEVKDNGMAVVKDSNYSLDERVQTHEIPISKMTGFKRT
jgi:CHAP domain.